MQGCLYIIPADPNLPHRQVRLDRAVTQAELSEAVGGSFEAVPHFTTIQQDGELQSCYAFCNEEGKLKGLPINHWATGLWNTARAREFGQDQSKWPVDPHEQLVGPIAIIYGNERFMDGMLWR